MDVPELATAIAKFASAETMRNDRHAAPGSELLFDRVRGTSHVTPAVRAAQV
jgi:hypothetical protein